MRMNTHIGFRHFSWRFYGLIAAGLFVWLRLDILYFIVDFIEPDIRLSPNIKLTAEWIPNVVTELEEITPLGDFPYYALAIWFIIMIVDFLPRIIEKFPEAVKEAIIGLSVLFFLGYLLFYRTIEMGLAQHYSHSALERAFITGKDLTAIKGIAYGTTAFLIFYNLFCTLLIANGVSNLYRLFLKFQNKGAFRRLFVLGYGGSSRWAHELEYDKQSGSIKSDSRKEGKSADKVFLGRTLFDDDPDPRLIFNKDDVHLVTMGMTGSGKSTTSLYTNLALYTGSVFVYDPKGQLPNQTYRRRLASDINAMLSSSQSNCTNVHLNGGRCHLLDPFGDSDPDLPHNRYNPLLEIDIASENYMDLVRAVADGCVVATGNEKEPHWNEWAKNMIEALIVHVLSYYPEKDHNLPFILDLFTGSAAFYYEVPSDESGIKIDRFNELLIDMKTNDAGGGLPKQVATRIMQMGDTEKGSILSTTYRGLKWAGDPAMRRHLIASDFLAGTVESYPRTVYYVLNSDRLSSQVQWIRVLTSVFLIQEKKNYKRYRPVTPTLFILDEYAQLGGRIDAVSSGFPILRDYSIKLWVIFQNLGQIKEAFGKSWSDVLSASTTQIFGVNDTETAEWVSKKLGVRNNRRTKRKKWYLRGELVSERIDQLMTPDEVTTELGKESPLQIIFPTHGRPMRLERLTYKPLNLSYSHICPVPFSLKGHFKDW